MKISIKTDDNNVVTGYATIGNIEGGIEIEVSEVPEDLWKKYYKLKDGKLMIDEELKAQIETTHSD